MITVLQMVRRDKSSQVTRVSGRELAQLAVERRLVEDYKVPPAKAAVLSGREREK